MTQAAHHELPAGLVVRTYKPADQQAVSRLYVEGLLSGQLAPNDTGVDIENIDEAYLTDPANHFWVAQSEGAILGMIGVARDEGHTAEIRRLRVERQWQQSPIGGLLVETAVAHCKRHGYLKVVLDTRFELGAAQDLFERFAFHHTRTKSVQGKDLLEFYLDLYRPPRKDPAKEAHKEPHKERPAGE
ncbi:MAG: GNAT family N-acetyltransferase [Planctomycetota bacterium]|nr:GNAT family N-acetyltransferase [Planctomycetota bacterium]